MIQNQKTIQKVSPNPNSDRTQKLTQTQNLTHTLNPIQALIFNIFSGKVEEDYPELPKANSIVALPADALKDAGSGMSNSSLSHMQQWLADMKKQGEDQLKGFGSISLMA